MQTHFIVQAAQAINAAIIANEMNIEALDRAIGDGDHYLNIRRGCASVVQMQQELSALAPDAALQKIGMKLLSTIGGASGPLIGSFFMSMGKAVKENGGESLPQIAAAFAAGVEAIRQRGKADVGQKTMLDVLIPVAQKFAEQAAAGTPRRALLHTLKQTAEAGVEATRNMMASKGRAAFLGERAIGHLDAGAKSSQVMIGAVCDLALEQ